MRTWLLSLGTNSALQFFLEGGGGPVGHEATLAAAQFEADVTLIDCSGIGGPSVLTDVVPSKTLIGNAEFTSAFAARAMHVAEYNLYKLKTKTKSKK